MNELEELIKSCKALGIRIVGVKESRISSGKRNWCGMEDVLNIVGGGGLQWLKKVYVCARTYHHPGSLGWICDHC